MYYFTTYNDCPAIMWYDIDTRSIYFADDTDSDLHKTYLEWVAAGNTAEEWTQE